ncbi:hypothetical protein [Halalkalibacter alkalisediminis]|uniref:Uncharacterized protein n=1 Tax=Halalkalibacter alkalisediminis TaxID=935616 RepID=A0ABV6NJG1_9BACI|nr:hypothetical protein [Halalkalibacter alkalisediminis]
MIPNITYAVRNPLVTKAMQIYASRDRRKSQQELNHSPKRETQGSITDKVELYGARYEVIERENQSSFDVKV